MASDGEIDRRDEVLAGSVLVQALAQGETLGWEGPAAQEVRSATSEENTMRIFLTGASGYLGGVLTEHLIAAGHQVRALARSREARERVTALGAQVVPGSLADTEILQEAAAGAEAVVHAAVDFTSPAMREVEEPALGAPGSLRTRRQRRQRRRANGPPSHSDSSVVSSKPSMAGAPVRA